MIENDTSFVIDLSDWEPEPLSEAKARLLARCNVLAAFEDWTRENYGNSWHGPLLTDRTPGPASKHGALDHDTISYIRLAWQHEVLLHVYRPVGSVGVARAAAAGLPVQAHYALFNAVRAERRVAGAPVDGHDKALRSFATQVAKDCAPPICMRLEGDPDDLPAATLTPEGVLVPASLPMVHPVKTTAHGPGELAFSGLRMARRWTLESKSDRWKSSNKTKQGAPYKRLPPGRRNKLLANMWPTTVLDVVYQLRVQSNYLDVDQFAADVSDDRIEDFHRGLRHVVSAGLLSLEVRIAERAGLKSYLALVGVAEGELARAGSWAVEPLLARREAISSALSS